AWTDNPAWILYDLMTNHSNGLGDYLDDMEDIDIFHLYEIGRYCDAVDDDGYFDGVPDATQGLEPRFSANFILQEQKNAFEVIGEIASLFRAMTYWNGGFFNFSIDNPKNVQAIFNNGNVFDGVFNYADVVSSARFTRVEVPYMDKDDNYKVKIEYVEDEEKMRKYGKRVNKQTGFGLTSKSQARRMAKYILFSNQFETEAVSFSAGQEAVLLAPGDIIQIEDEIKNFEINYGKILGVNTSQGYLDLENSFKTGSIVTGENGGLYTYNNKQQTDVKALYNLIKFDRTTEVGVNEDIYSGVVPLDKVDSIDEEQITKFIITGVEERDNSHRVYIDQNDQSYDDLTGVIKGTFFNIELENRDTNFFKVVKITEEGANKYNINALEYQIDKFTYIEQEDFDLVETQYNIGIPTNTINRPPEPAGFTHFLTGNEYGSYNLTGTITGEVGGNELKYRVSLIYPNGKYTTHEFLKDATSSPPQTDYEILNLSTYGDYTVNVTSLRNPESSKSLESNFRINLPAKIREHFLIKSVNVQNEYSNTYTPEGLTGQGSIVPQTKDYVFKLKLEDMRGGDMAHNPKVDPSLDIYINDELYKENYTTTTFRFSHEDNINLFGNAKRDLNIKFELKDKNQKLHHTAKLSINNTAPIISNVAFDPPRVNFDTPTNSKYDLKKINVYNSNASGNLEFIKTEFIAEGQTYINVSEASDTDALTLIPFDHYGSGIAVTGIIYEQPEQEAVNSQNSQSFNTIYICKGVGESITQDSNNQTGIFWQVDQNYIIKGSLSYMGSGSYNTDFYVGEDKIFNISGTTNQTQKTVSFMEFVNNQSGFKKFSFVDQSSGLDLGSFFFEVDEST
ncbi:MAG: phage tail protein, partial [Flavobacteriales bacterium]